MLTLSCDSLGTGHSSYMIEGAGMRPCQHLYRPPSFCLGRLGFLRPNIIFSSSGCWARLSRILLLFSLPDPVWSFPGLPCLLCRSQLPSGSSPALQKLFSLSLLPRAERWSEAECWTLRASLFRPFQLGRNSQRGEKLFSSWLDPKRTWPSNHAALPEGSVFHNTLCGQQDTRIFSFPLLPSLSTFFMEIFHEKETQKDQGGEEKR